MIPREEFLKQKENAFDRQKDHLEQQMDVEELEALICINSLLVTCYQTLAWLVHNQTIRKECQQFEQHLQYHLEELRKIFPLSQKSEVAIEMKTNQHLLQLKPAYLSLRELINLAINLSSLKMVIYKYLFHTVQGHHDLLNGYL